MIFRWGHARYSPNGSPPRPCPGSRRSTRSRSPSGCWRFRGRTRAAPGSRFGRAPSGAGAAEVDRALSEDRSLLITWVNRGTLAPGPQRGLSAAAALTTPPLLPPAGAGCGRRGCARRWRAGDGDDREGARRGGAADPRAAAGAARLGGVRTDGPALIHLIFLAALRGVLVRGPMIGKQHAYVLVSDWLGPQQPSRSRQAPLAELARRYLAGHGPADDRDLARWAGLPLRDARAGLDAIASELVQREDGLVDLAGAERSQNRCRRRACSAPTTRCCSAGPRARRSSARTSCWSRTTASSAPSPSSTAAPSPLGPAQPARSRSSPSPR